MTKPGLDRYKIRTDGSNRAPRVKGLWTRSTAARLFYLKNKGFTNIQKIQGFTLSSKLVKTV